MFLAYDTPIGERSAQREPGYWSGQQYHVVEPCRVPLGVYTMDQLQAVASELQAAQGLERAKSEARQQTLRFAEANKPPEQRAYERDRQQREQEAEKCRHEQALFNEKIAAIKARNQAELVALEALIAHRFCCSK